ncbi:DUF1707 domain-containing protein [Candidatus Solirubrobacter pratensis]|uniref:DUF1707 domain-containing protein n=1 Tax=Candidatus Solirubrobacter pratensis TaxID=1298857 RepID=UPI0003F95397|nr:DUF1707 domain-containing protein [Candidatus Solirubrobacter pratensis]
MTPSSQLQLRATDADREHVAQMLRASAGEGALMVDELEERLSAAYVAVTRADLARLVADLPPRHTARPAMAPAPEQPVLGVDRSPGLVALLTVVTLGLYLIYWWYTVNREMRDFARTVQPTHPLAGASPVASTLAMTLGTLIIVPVFVTAHSTARRVGEAMSLSGLPPHDRPSPLLYTLAYTIGGLLIVPQLLYAPLLQGHLNRAWQQVRAAQEPGAGDWLASAAAA